MSTDAKRAGNARYLAKLKTITVRMQPETAETLQRAATSAGESVNAYIVGAVAQRMERDASRHATETRPANTMQNVQI